MVALPPAGVLAEIAIAIAGFVFLLVGWTALRNWVFELSPNEWLYTLIISFALGVFFEAYLDGNGLMMLLALIPLFLAMVWWLGRLLHRHRVRSAAAEG